MFKKIIMKRVKNSLLIITTVGLMASCHSYSVNVGTGGTKEVIAKKTNTYFIGGLIKGKISNSKEMAKGEKNYTVKTEQTFLNGLWSVLTFGIYTPTKTTITK